MKHAEQRLLGLGCPKVSLQVRTRNVNAIREPQAEPERKSDSPYESGSGTALYSSSRSIYRSVSGVLP
jgi:hypothetical protein